MTQQTALARANGTGQDLADLAPSFVMGLEELKRQVIELDHFKREVMQEGTDFGVIPGTPKPSLYKPGAEKLCQVFGLLPEFITRDKVLEWERGFFHYEVECRLVSRRTGLVVANGLGEANSMEGRYRWRDERPRCEHCGFELRKSKNQPEWYCWRSKGGCGVTYPLDAIQAGGKVENDDPYTLVNTLLKMAQKRALVAGTLVATAASGIFTQDVEDYVLDAPVVRETVVHHSPERTKEVRAERQATPETTAAVEQPTTATTAEPDAEPLITSPRDRRYQRWTELYLEAKSLGLEVEPIKIPMPLSELTERGTRLKAEIADAKAARALRAEVAEQAEPVEPGEQGEGF